MIRGFTPGELLTEAEKKIEWILPDVAPVGARILLTGPPEIGKSLLATELAVSAATGTAFLDTFRPWTSCSVVLFTMEPRARVVDRLTGFLTLRQMVDAPLLRIVHDTVSFETEDGCTQLREAVNDLRPQILIVDPIEAYVSNDAAALLRLRDLFVEIGSSLKTTIVLCGKENGPCTSDVMKAWGQLHLQMLEDAARRQVVLTTAKRGPESPLVRLVLAGVTGTAPGQTAEARDGVSGRYIRFLPWPAEPLPLFEAKVYDVLRIQPVTMRKLRTLVRAHHWKVQEALASLAKKGLVSVITTESSVGGGTTVNYWRANPVTGRLSDDPTAFLDERHGPHTTRGEKRDWARLAVSSADAEDREARRAALLALSAETEGTRREKRRALQTATAEKAQLRETYRARRSGEDDE